MSQSPLNTIYSKNPWEEITETLEQAQNRLKDVSQVNVYGSVNAEIQELRCQVHRRKLNKIRLDLQRLSGQKELELQKSKLD